MRMSTMRQFVSLYRGCTLSEKREIVRKVWGADGLDGIETLATLSGVEVDQLAAIAGLGPNVARARARRERIETTHQRPRQPIPRGFRAEVQDVAEQAAHGRGFMPKRHWEPLHPTR